MDKKELKVFIISPSDVEEERNEIRKLITKTNSYLKHIKLSPIIWEYYSLDATKNPQVSINSALKSSDIYLIVLWNRIGTTVEGTKGAITNRVNITGTEYEIEWVLANKKQDIYAFFKDATLPNIKNEELVELGKQREKLEVFLKHINLEKNSTKRAYQNFKSINVLKEKVLSTINEILKRKYNETIPIDKILNQNTNNSEAIIKNEPHPNYYVGLYVFMTVILIWVFLYMLNSKDISQDTRLLYDFSLVSYLALLTIPIKNLPTDPTIIYNSTFKDILFSLLRIGLFIIVAAFAMGFTIWYFLLPPLKQLLGYIFM